MKHILLILSSAALLWAGATKDYSVKSGDTLYTIARDHAMTINEVLKLNNNIQYNSTLKVGQKLKVATYAGRTQKYIVKPGDNPIKLARKFKMKLKDLIQANGIDLRKKPIYIGQTLLIKEQATFGDKIVQTAKKYLGIRYKWGGNDPKRGIDCSRFAQLVYENYGVKLPRVSGDQYEYALKHGKKVAMKDAKKGDLIFFRTRRRWIGHVGIIIDPKKHLFQQSSSGAGKNNIARYDIGSYRRRLRGICRIKVHNS